MKTFGGSALFLDRADINTDEIIPAKYLTEITKTALKPYLLEDLVVDGFDPRRDIPGKRVVVSRANFGCGSSREHAPWALEVNDINVVIAESFARIFRQNIFNCGMLAIDLAPAVIAHLFDTYADTACTIGVDLDNATLTVSAAARSEVFAIAIAEFDEALVRAGGWVEFADSKY